MNLSVIVPTTGRETLARTLVSITSQLGASDEVLLCGSPMMASTDARVRVIRCARGGYWGAKERMAGIAAARGTHLAFLDDDDMYLPKAIQKMHAAIAATPHRPILGRMLRNGEVLWRGRTFMLGNIGTPMFLLPNDPSKFGTWGDLYDGDFYFLQSSQWRPEDFVWLPEILVHCNPHEAEHNPYMRDFTTQVQL